MELCYLSTGSELLVQPRVCFSQHLSRLASSPRSSGEDVRLGSGRPGEGKTWGMEDLGSGRPGEWKTWGVDDLGSGRPGEWTTWGVDDRGRPGEWKTWGVDPASAEGLFPGVVATLPGAWRYGVSVGTGRLGVSIL